MAGRPSKLTKQVEADLTLMLAQGVPIKLAAAGLARKLARTRRERHG